MTLENEVELELRKINFSRNRFAYLFQYVLLIASVWIQTGFFGTYTSFILALGGTGCLLRLFSTEIIPEEKKVSDFFLRIGFVFLSTAWVIHIDQTLQLHTISGETIPALRVMVGALVLLNHALLVADIVSHYAFLVPIAIGLLAEVYLFDRSFYQVPLLSYFGISLVSSIGLHYQHRQLKSFLRARLEANRERARLKKIMEGIPGYVSICSSEGTYIDANQQLLRLFPDLIGSKIGELSGQSKASLFALEFLNSGKESATGETDATINGEQFHLMTTCGRLDEGIIIISLPTNELMKAKKELREKEAVAVYSSKLASVGQMAAGVAHEVNNPLAIIQGSASIIASLVEEEKIDRKNLRTFSERIVTTAERIARIVKSLRSLTRGGEQDPFAPLSLQNLISTCEDLSRHRLKRYDVKFEVPALKKDMMILGREVQLGQVLLNLISNSIDAVKDLPDRWVKINCGHQDGELWIEVTDAGNGIPKEVADKIMEPFFTTKKEEGTGLGLPISLKIMEEHGGKLQYLAEKENTTFRMSFPTPKI